MPAVLNHDKFVELLDFVEHYEVKQLICELKELKTSVSEKGSLRQAIDELMIKNGCAHKELKEFLDRKAFIVSTEEDESISTDKLIFDLNKKLKTNSLLRQRDQLSF